MIQFDKYVLNGLKPPTSFPLQKIVTRENFVMFLTVLLERLMAGLVTFLYMFFEEWMIFGGNTPTPKTNMTTENPPFEDVFPVENGEFPM